MNCSQCGKEIPDDSDFCTYCGAETGVAGAAAAAQPPQQPPAAPPPQGQAPPPPPGGAAPPPPGQPPPPGAPEKKRSALPWMLGTLGLIAVVAVVLVLVFVVFKGGGDSNTPEEVANNYLRALEEKDVDLLLSTIDPDSIKELENTTGADYREILEELVFGLMPDDLQFRNMKYETKIDGDTAEVMAVAGTLSYTDPMTGEPMTEDVMEGDGEPLKMVKVDGTWYISGEDLELGMPATEDDYLDEDYLDDGLTEDDIIDDDLGVELPVDSDEEVLMLLLMQPEVQDWYAITDYPLYEITDEGTTYAVYLYEEYDGEIYDFGWYIVDKETGDVEVYVP
jgi:hypothetical protein